jgi:hypothetical protein
MKVCVLTWSLSFLLAACSAPPAPHEEQAATATGGAVPASAVSARVAAPLVRDGDACTADDECASGACNVAERACKASRDAPCSPSIGCAQEQVCAAECATGAGRCDRRTCRDVIRDVTCATGRDCKHGALCDEDHLCKWRPGARCDWSIAWCAEDEVCCPARGGHVCMPRQACRE